MELLEPVGGDVWALPCPRALDHTPPGDWTLAFRRDDDGNLVDAEAYVSGETDLATLTANFVGADKFIPAPSGSMQSAKAMFALVTA